MKQKINSKSDCMKIEVNGRKIKLIFQSEPNLEAAEFIKKTLLDAYRLKAI